MKILSREFTFAEKILLLVLSLFLVGAVYYFLVHKPVTETIRNCRNEEETLSMELEQIQAGILQLEQMQSELDTIKQNDNVSVMESYNNSKAELRFLNDILEKSLIYTVSFDNVTMDGDQIRRSITLRFTAEDYDSARELITELYNCPYRCLISSISMKAEQGNVLTDAVSVTLSATFYETMVGGTEDAGLPSEE